VGNAAFAASCLMFLCSKSPKTFGASIASLERDAASTRIDL
jgi:hypothetical protein